MKTCKRCKTEHESRWAMCDRCREKQRAYSVKWREENYQPKPRRQKMSAEERRAQRRDWYQRNREREIARQIAWQRANPERGREIARETYRRRMSDPAKLAAERARCRLKQFNRNRLVAATGGNFTPSQLLARLSMYPRCWICKTAEATHVDHVKPLARGGAHILANLRPACADCNLRKGQQWPFPT